MGRKPTVVLGVFIGALVVALGVALLASGKTISGPHRGTATKSGNAAAPTTTTTTLPKPPPAPPSDTRRLSTVKNVGGPISPKSVVASGHGIVVAQNMMYRHSVSVFGADGAPITTIDDSITLANFGVEGHPGVSRGAPVEAAFSPDGKYVYVTNYAMYGAGFGPEGKDDCTPRSGVSNSFLYRINLANYAVDAVAAVGAVPKYVAVTPDGATVLVTNWCSWDLSVVDAATMKETRRVKLEAYPRGIAIVPGSQTAYIAVMGARSIAKVAIGSGALTWLRNVGNGPRHLVMDSTGRWLYATLNQEGAVIKIDTQSDTVVRRVRTGQAPRSMAIAPDDLSLYVVNYESHNVTKLRAADLGLLQTVPTGTHPIGITYEPMQHRVWVAIYTGNILVLADS
ncbi:MAG: cytochrome D1 domain-containing protein [Acidimicrobiia bacterium]